MSNEKNKKFEIDMCNGPILKKMLIFAIPLICSSVLQLLFNAVDAGTGRGVIPCGCIFESIFSRYAGIDVI